jgi:EAL domain-containing protein (putative c-di-GMP-specific phosphodiesterase class I)
VLRALGGDVIQGYVISHPLRGEDLEHLLIRRSAITSVD